MNFISFITSYHSFSSLFKPSYYLSFRSLWFINELLAVVGFLVLNISFYSKNLIEKLKSSTIKFKQI
jgi:hypothetical protein